MKTIKKTPSFSSNVCKSQGGWGSLWNFPFSGLHLWFLTDKFVINWPCSRNVKKFEKEIFQFLKLPWKHGVAWSYLNIWSSLNIYYVWYSLSYSIWCFSKKSIQITQFTFRLSMKITNIYEHKILWNSWLDTKSYLRIYVKKKMFSFTTSYIYIKGGY